MGCPPNPPPKKKPTSFGSVSRRICFERKCDATFQLKIVGKLNLLKCFGFGCSQTSQWSLETWWAYSITVMLGTWNGRNLSFHHLHPPIKTTRHPLQGRTSSTTSPCVILSQASSTAEKKSYPENTKRPQTVRRMILGKWFRNPANQLLW